MINRNPISFATETHLDCQVCYKVIEQTSITETFDKLLENRKSFNIKKMVLQKTDKVLEKFEDRPWNDN